jgi:hypothetical protein
VNEASHNSLTKILTFAAVVEIGTGSILMIDPSVVIKLLLGIEDTNAGTLLGRFLGVALLSLGVACWPGRPEHTTGLQSFWGMLAYNALVALYLASLGTVGHLGGSLLWPAVVLHAILALLLVWASRNTRRTDLIHK